MLTNIKMEFEKARMAERVAEGLLAELLPAGTIISYKKGNMRVAGDASVSCVSGRRVKIFSFFSKVERWIDLDDVEAVRRP